MGKKWKRLYVAHGVFVKPPIIKPGSLDEHGFESVVAGPNERKCLESFIRSGIPCMKHSAFYLKEWKFKFLESESYLLRH